MPLTDAEKAALNRLGSYYEGDNPYNSVSNPGGFRQGGHLYNFVPALKDLATVIVGAARLAVEVAANSAQSPKALRVDSQQSFTDSEKLIGQGNLGIADTLKSVVKKTGDAMSGDLTLSAGFLYLGKGAGSQATVWRQFSWTDGSYHLQGSPDGGGNYGLDSLMLTQGGAISTPQLGDLNTRIESRGAAYQAAAQATSVQKAGGTMTGNLAFSGYVGARFVVANQSDILIRAVDGGKLQVCDGAATVEYFSVKTDGSVNTKQFGDLNTRIENRGQAWALNYYNQTVTGVRLTYGADYGNDVAADGATYWEPFGGCVITGRMTYYNSSGNGYFPAGFRFRFLQVYIPNSGWFTVGFA